MDKISYVGYVKNQKHVVVIEYSSMVVVCWVFVRVVYFTYE